METQIAINTLKSMRDTLSSNIAGYQAQVDSINVAIDQLEGTLQSQLVELETAKIAIQRKDAEIAGLADALDAANAANVSPIINP